MAAILIVDHDPSRDAGYQRALGSHFSVILAREGQEAVALAEGYEPIIVLLRSDLAKQNPLAIWQAIQKLPKGLSIKSILSGPLDSADDEGLAFQFSILLPEPLTVESLRAAITWAVNAIKAEQGQATPEQLVRAKTAFENQVAQAKQGQGDPLISSAPRATTSATMPPASQHASPPHQATPAKPVLPPAKDDPPDDKLKAAVEKLVGSVPDHDWLLVGQQRTRYVFSVYQRLDELDYYQILEIPYDADRKQIKSAYFRKAKTYHTDRFQQLNNRDLFERFHQVFKRIAEGYHLLMNEDKRPVYLHNLKTKRGPETVRWVEKGRDSGNRAPDADIKHPVAKKFFNLALKALEENNVASAKMNLQMALGQDKDNPVIKGKLEEVRMMEG